MDKRRREIFDSIESGDYNLPICSYGIVGVSDAVEESLTYSFDRFSSFSEISNLEFYGEDIFKFIYEDEEYYGSIKTINNNSKELRPRTLFSDEELEKIFNVRTIILLQISVGKDILKSYRLHYKLCNVLVPSLVAVQDLFLGTNYSGSYVNLVKEYESFLNPVKCINVSDIEIGDRKFLVTTGLLRFGIFELAVEIGRTENAVQIASKLIHAAARNLIYKSIPLKTGVSVDVIQGEELVFEPLEEYFERHGEVFGDSGDDFTDYVPVVSISTYGKENFSDIDYEKFEDEMTPTDIPVETERNKDNAFIFLPFLEYLYFELDADAEVMLTLQRGEGDYEFEVWFKVTEIFDEYIKGFPISIGGLENLEHVAEVDIVKEDVKDWKVYLDSDILVPEDSYISYKGYKEDINPIIIHNKDTLLEQLKLWKNEGKYDEIKKVLKDKMPLFDDEKLIYVETLVKLNQYDEAVFALSTAYFDYKDNYQYYMLLSDLMLKLFNYKAGLEFAEKAISLEPDLMPLKVIKVKCLYNLSRYAETEELIKEIKDELNKGSVLPKYMVEDIDNIFKDVLKHKYKKTAEDLLPRLNLLFYNGKYVEVVKTVEEKYEGDNKNVIVLYIRSLIKLKRFQKAKTELEKLESVASGDMDWNEMLSDVYSGLGDEETAAIYSNKIEELSDWYEANKLEFIEETAKTMDADNRCIYFNYYPNDNSFLVFFDYNNEAVKDDIARKSTGKERLYKETLEEFIIKFYTNSNKKKIEKVTVIDHRIVVVEFKDSYILGKDLLDYLIEKTMEMSEIIRSGNFLKVFSNYEADLMFYDINLEKNYDLRDNNSFKEFEKNIYNLSRVGHTEEAKMLAEHQVPIKAVLYSIEKNSNLEEEYIASEYINAHLIYITSIIVKAAEYYDEIVDYIEFLMALDISEFFYKSLLELRIYAEVSRNVINSNLLDDFLSHAENLELVYDDMYDVVIQAYQSAKTNKVEETLERFFLFRMGREDFMGMYHYLISSYRYIKTEDEFLTLIDELMSIDDVSKGAEVLELVRKIGYRQEEVLVSIIVDKLIFTRQYQYAKDYISKLKPYNLDNIINLSYIGIKMGNYYMVKKHADTIYREIDLSSFSDEFKIDKVLLTYLYSLYYIGDYSTLYHLLMFVSSDSQDYKKLTQRLYKMSSRRIVKDDFEEYLDFLKLVDVGEKPRYLN